MGPVTLALKVLIFLLMSLFLLVSAHRSGAGYSTVARLLSGSGARAEARIGKPDWSNP